MVGERGGWIWLCVRDPVHSHPPAQALRSRGTVPAGKAEREVVALLSTPLNKYDVVTGAPGWGWCVQGWGECGSRRTAMCPCRDVACHCHLMQRGGGPCTCAECPPALPPPRQCWA